MTEGKALLVCAQNRGADKLKRLLRADSPWTEVETASSAAEARRMAAETEYGVIILNAPLAGETGLELAEELAERSRTSILLLVREELMSVFFQPATEAGVLVVGKPVVPQVFRQSVWMAAAMRNRLLALGRANEKLHARLEETRVIDRAKCLLIQHRQLSEAEAHHALERLAMDRRTTKVKAAMEVLRRFGM